MSGKSIPSDFIKNVLQNGVGRYVCQLQRLTVCFCKSNGASRGTRDFIENQILDFTRQHPGIVLYLKPRRHRSPQIVAEYLNGRQEVISIHNMQEEEICKWVEHLRTRSGVQIMRLRKMWHTETPSVQGVWSPFTNRDSKLNITTFPNEELSQAPAPVTATSQLLEIAKQLRAKKQMHLSEKE